MNADFKTVGGVKGHVVRRIVHMAMAIYPFLYYDFGQSIAAFFATTPQAIVIILVSLVIILDLIRIAFGSTVFGQREHEAGHPSSFAWAAVALGIVLLFAPKLYAVPIIWSCAFVDPLIGEMRRFQVHQSWVAVVGIICVIGLWLLATLWWGTPWWMALIMGPIIIAAEWPNLKWVDDNFLMMIVPLLVTFFI